MAHDSRYGDLNTLAVKLADYNEKAHKANEIFWKSLLYAASTGALLRASSEIPYLFKNRRSSSLSQPSFSSVKLDLPEEDKKKKKEKWVSKSAKDSSYPSFTLPAFDQSNVLTGSQATSPWTIPSLPAMGIPLGIGALMGGWKIPGWLIDKGRELKEETELSHAKKKYRKLVKELLSKESDAKSVDNALDSVIELIKDSDEKRAGDDWEFPATKATADALKSLVSGTGSALSHASEAWNVPIAALATWLPLATIASGLASYNYFKKKDPERIYQKAQQKRRAERTGGMPPIQLER